MVKLPVRLLLDSLVLLMVMCSVSYTVCFACVHVTLKVKFVSQKFNSQISYSHLLLLLQRTSSGNL